MFGQAEGLFAGVWWGGSPLRERAELTKFGKFTKNTMMQRWPQLGSFLRMVSHTMGQWRCRRGIGEPLFCFACLCLALLCLAPFGFALLCLTLVCFAGLSLTWLGFALMWGFLVCCLVHLRPFSNHSGIKIFLQGNHQKSVENINQNINRNRAPPSAAPHKGRRYVCWCFGLCFPWFFGDFPGGKSLCHCGLKRVCGGPNNKRELPVCNNIHKNSAPPSAAPQRAAAFRAAVSYFCVNFAAYA